MTPQIVMIHHLTGRQIEGMLKRIPYCDGITTASRRWKSRLERLTDREAILIPYTVDTRIFRPTENRLRLRRTIGIGDNDFVLGFVANAKANSSGRKGIDVLLTVLETAGQTWDDLFLLLVGPGWEELGIQIEAIGIPVIRYEFETTEDTASVYPLMDALLCTSREEGGPVTILEAMACGVPVVTSDVGHVPEVVTDGETGFVCPSRTPREYIQKIALLRSNPDLRRRIVIQAREFTERRRDERVVIPRIDFPGLYAGAIDHYYKRPIAERIARLLPYSRLAARYVASSVLVYVR